MASRRRVNAPRMSGTLSKTRQSPGQGPGGGSPMLELKERTVTTKEFDTRNIRLEPHRWLRPYRVSRLRCRRSEPIRRHLVQVCRQSEDRAAPPSRGLPNARAPGRAAHLPRNGEVKEIRPVGSYVFTAAGGEPHTEGGGDQDVIVFFSNRNVDWRHLRDSGRQSEHDHDVRHSRIQGAARRPEGLIETPPPRFCSRGLSARSGVCRLAPAHG